MNEPRNITFDLNFDKQIKLKKPKQEIIIKKKPKEEYNEQNQVPVPAPIPEIVFKTDAKITLSRNGYRLRKSFYTIDQLDKVRKDLTVAPFVGSDEEEVKPYPIYRETPAELIIPKFYGIGQFGEADRSSLKCEKTLFQFTKNLRDIQMPIVNICIEHLKKNKGGFLSVGCGAGKTVMALKMAAEIGLKTLVVVHKTFLQDQWIERIKQFTDARYGIIRQDKVQVKDKDIVVGMIQSISMKDYDPNIFEGFGCIIYDEVHHAASRVFSNCLFKCGAEYTIGLSATLQRKDGLTKVLHWYLGQMMYSEKAKINKQVIVKTIHYKSKDPLFREKKRWRAGGMTADVVKMTTNICDLDERTKHLIDIIDELRKQPERKILILSGRKAHLTAMKNGVDTRIAEDVENGIIEQNECRTYFYTGDNNRKERKDAEDNGDVLFGTFELAQEGLDIERLNTIILATPKKNIVQAVGRIMRKVLQSGDVRPLIIDYCDVLSVFESQGIVREKHYISHKYRIENYYIKNNKIITFDDYMMQEENYSLTEVQKLANRTIYEPTWKSILDMQRVEDEYAKGDVINDNDNDNDNNEIMDDNEFESDNEIDITDEKYKKPIYNYNKYKKPFESRSNSNTNGEYMF